MKLNIKFSNKYLPENNFYLWVNQEWKDNNKIPDDFQRWGTFNILQNENEEKLKKILETTNEKKLSILYEQGLNRNNNNEIYEYLDDIQKCSNLESLLNLIIDYQMLFQINSPFGIGIYNDFNESKKNILHILSGGLDLPDRDYYFLESKLNERVEYKEFLKKYTEFFNLKLNIDLIYKIEEKLAKYTYTNLEKRNPELQNNICNYDEILLNFPTFTFLPYLFKKINKKPEKINLINPKFLKKLNKMFSEKVTFQLWKDYFKVKLLLTVNSYLSEDIEEIYFNFYSKILAGVPKMKSLWERSLHNVDNKLGFLLGKYFIEKHFNENSKKIVFKLIDYVKLILIDRIKNLDWMSKITKDKALEKLNLMTIKIGYPEKWREYKSDIKKEYSYLKNNILCNLDDAIFSFSKLYQSVDKTEFHMVPQHVNAYYSPSNNEIVFPAGILQSPFFSENYDVGLNFGGIVTIIGHEITHAFDDEGSKYDAYGNLNNWWSEEDIKNYKKNTEQLINQFNKYSINDEFVNGKLTLGENIADLGGITIALEALKKYLLDNPKENLLIDNLTPIQRFFINYTRVWRSNTRKEEIKNRLLTDVHSPPEFRVNGILKNIDDFYIAFKIKNNNYNKIKIW